MSEGKLDNKEINTTQTKEIDLVELMLKIWAERKFLFKVCGIAAILGVIIAFSFPKEYETKIILAPETVTKSSLGGSMGALASMAGINLSGSSSQDAIYPELYPNIINSTPFLVELFDIQIVTKKGDLKTSLYDYIEKHQKAPWWGYILSIPSRLLGWGISLFKETPPKGGGVNVDSFQLTYDQSNVARAIKGRISSSVDKKTDVISLTVRMQDPYISAVLADSVKNQLQEYITDYRTNKARQDLIFAEKLYTEAKEQYFTSQQAYAAFTDGNKNIVMARYKTEAERLQNEMNLAYGVYNQVTQQLQIAKAKVQEITPVYTVVQPATVPLQAASPKKVMILIVFIFLGAFGASCWILFKDIFLKWRKQDH